MRAVEKEPFRVAVLILAHKNLGQVARMIDRLSHQSVDVFVHIDRKCTLADWAQSLQALNGGRVYISRQRHSISLFSYRMVEAELSLIDDVLEHGRQNSLQYHYLLLLSGQDYPVRPVEGILSELQRSYPKPFIDVTLWHPGNWVETSFGRVWACKECRAAVRNAAISIRPLVLGTGIRGLNHVFFLALSKARELILGTPLERMSRARLEAAGGSQWWILPQHMAEEVLRVSQDRRIVGVFRDVGSADETYFQSVLVNSAFRNELTINHWSETKQNTRTYTDFYGGSPVSAGHPVVLTEKDLVHVAESGALFARKFDESVDSRILDLIDARLLAVELVR